MGDALAHRGPDREGYLVLRDECWLVEREALVAASLRASPADSRIAG
jgi:hypothetical protein